TKVTCPVLVVAGGQDRIVPASVVRQVANKYKAVSTYKEFENQAHMVVTEPGWQEVAEHVAGWLRPLRRQSAPRNQRRAMPGRRRRRDPQLRAPLARRLLPARA